MAQPTTAMGTKSCTPSVRLRLSICAHPLTSSFQASTLCLCQRTLRPRQSRMPDTWEDYLRIVAECNLQRTHVLLHSTALSYKAACAWTAKLCASAFLHTLLAACAA